MYMVGVRVRVRVGVKVKTGLGLGLGLGLGFRAKRLCECFVLENYKLRHYELRRVLVYEFAQVS